VLSYSKIDRHPVILFSHKVLNKKKQIVFTIFNEFLERMDDEFSPLFHRCIKNARMLARLWYVLSIAACVGTCRSSAVLSLRLMFHSPNSPPWTIVSEQGRLPLGRGKGSAQAQRPCTADV
jgi:hypothetical protein